MEDVLPVSSRVFKVRSRLGWTQQRLAQEIGVTQASVNRWEKGRKVPRPTTLARFEEFEKLVASGQFSFGEPPGRRAPAARTIRLHVTLDIPLDIAPETLESVLRFARSLPAGAS